MFLPGSFNSLETAMVSIAVILVMLGATALTWPINEFILKTFHIEFLQTLVFILVIAALVQIVEAK